MKPIDVDKLIQNLNERINDISHVSALMGIPQPSIVTELHRAVTVLSEQQAAMAHLHDLHCQRNFDAERMISRQAITLQEANWIMEHMEPMELLLKDDLTKVKERLVHWRIAYRSRH